MNVLVIGATGPTGREIVRQGVALGHAVTAVVRHPETAALPQGVHVLGGDVMNAESLVEAVRGQEVVLNSLGSKIDRNPTTLFSQGTRNLLAAMNQNSVRRLLCITGVGAGDSRGHGGFLYDRIFQPLLLKEIYLDKDRQEAIVRESGVDWTLVRPGTLTNGPKTGQFRVLSELTGITVGKIARADVAQYLLDHLQDPATFGKTVNLTY